MLLVALIFSFDYVSLSPQAMTTVDETLTETGLSFSDVRLHLSARRPHLWKFVRLSLVLLFR